MKKNCSNVILPDASNLMGVQLTKQASTGREVVAKKKIDDRQTKFLSPKMERMLNEQVGKEFFSAYLYYAIAAWFASKGLVGFQSWMERQGDDEIGHANKVLKYIIDTGSKVALPTIKSPSINFDTAQAATKAALDHEMEVTGDWTRINAQAKKDDNAATCKLTQEFMDEQIEEEDQAVSLYQRVQMADTGSGILVIDMELKERDPNQIIA